MNEGAFRDQKKLCGFCQQPIGNDCRIIPFNKDGRATFHPNCWEPFEKSVKGEIELAIHNNKWEKEMRWNKFWDGFWEWIGRVAALAAVGLAVWLIVMASMSEDAYVYCQIEEGNDGKFNLIGVRDWASDQDIGTFSSIDAAMEAAGKIGCKVR